MSDPTTTYRTHEEVQRTRSIQDPIRRLQKYIEECMATEQELKVCFGCLSFLLFSSFTCSTFLSSFVGFFFRLCPLSFIRLSAFLWLHTLLASFLFFCRFLSFIPPPSLPSLFCFLSFFLLFPLLPFFLSFPLCRSLHFSGLRNSSNAWG